MSKAKRQKGAITPAFVLQALAVFVVGSLIGVSLFTIIYAKGYSYLGNDPKACINCHVMNRQYDAWLAGSHAEAATCNDCHVPHTNIVHKYLVKGEHGLNHGYKFTTGKFPDNIVIRDSSLKVTNDTCLHCHSDVTADMYLARDDSQIQCTHCHTNVGHKSR